MTAMPQAKSSRSTMAGRLGRSDRIELRPPGRSPMSTMAMSVMAVGINWFAFCGRLVETYRVTSRTRAASGVPFPTVDSCRRLPARPLPHADASRSGLGELADGGDGPGCLPTDGRPVSIHRNTKLPACENAEARRNLAEWVFILPACR